jgi:hypothetical protein
MAFTNSQIKGIIAACIVGAVILGSIGSGATSLKKKNIGFSEAVRGVTNPYTKSIKKSISSSASWETNPDKASGSKKRRKSRKRNSKPKKT